MNTLPATMRDPQFRDKALIDFLDKAQVTPERIVIEITEHLVIENYDIFRDTMAYFTALGMSFAVDDVGAGYSGLETIAKLKPSYLKIDMGLVRDVHASAVNRRMVKALIALGHGIGAEVIAEGIQNEEEAQVLRGDGRRLRPGLPPRPPRRRPGAGLRTLRGASTGPSGTGTAPGRAAARRRGRAPARGATRSPFTRVKFVEPRSTTTQASPRLSRRAWRRETRGSSTRIATSSSRPTSSTSPSRGNSTSRPSRRSQTRRAAALTGRPAARRGPPPPARRCR